MQLQPDVYYYLWVHAQWFFNDSWKYPIIGVYKVVGIWNVILIFDIV